MSLSGFVKNGPTVTQLEVMELGFQPPKAGSGAQKLKQATILPRKVFKHTSSMHILVITIMVRITKRPPLPISPLKVI